MEVEKLEVLKSELKMTFLFNFSHSYSGGGLKRLLAYSKYFDEND